MSGRADPELADFYDPRMVMYGTFISAFVRIERRLGRLLEEESGLPHVWFEVLGRLAKVPDTGIAMGALADQVLLTSGGITRLIDRMEAAGLVERVRDTTDRRVYRARITDKGIEVRRRAVPGHAANVERYVTGLLSEDELATFTELLRRMGRPA